MRLSQQAQTIIRDTVEEIFGPDARVILFGSRTDDTARGGDIDLLVQLDSPDADRQRKALKLVARLQMRLGDQPIDVLVLDPDTRRLPVHEEALSSGVRL
ncbi:MAG TPA: nucleotidyltransferase domain-containing protein [Gammaproteobacteria bacterium]|nr:nucleotidyltransferase domain-containing protein [Gammaproteobacteria bacterium]